MTMQKPLWRTASQALAKYFCLVTYFIIIFAFEVEERNLIKFNPWESKPGHEHLQYEKKKLDIW